MTKIATPTQIDRKWVLVDASNKKFGRVLTEVATILRGKNKPCFTPNIDCGDYVVIINASQAVFSGNKKEDKYYHRHSGYFGSVKSEKLADLLIKNPVKLYKISVRGMLPKTKLGKAMLKKLKVYAGSEHPHTSQFPKDKGAK